MDKDTQTKLVKELTRLVDAFEEIGAAIRHVGLQIEAHANDLIVHDKQREHRGLTGEDFRDVADGLTEIASAISGKQVVKERCLCPQGMLNQRCPVHGVK